MLWVDLGVKRSVEELPDVLQLKRTYAPDIRGLIAWYLNVGLYKLGTIIIQIAHIL
jgi:hypothetical protein